MESSWTLLARCPAGYYFTLDSSGGVPTYLNGIQVLINGKPAPLLYTSLSQINAIVPYEIEGERSHCTSPQHAFGVSWRRSNTCSVNAKILFRSRERHQKGQHLSAVPTRLQAKQEYISPASCLTRCVAPLGEP